MMITIVLDDLDNAYFDRNNLDIKLCFKDNDSALLHFDSLDEFRMYRDYVIDNYLC